MNTGFFLDHIRYLILKAFTLCVLPDATTSEAVLKLSSYFYKIHHLTLQTLKENRLKTSLPKILNLLSVCFYFCAM